MAELSDYTLLECLHAGTSTRVSTVRQSADAAVRVVKQGVDPGRQRSALVHEYELGRRCQGAGVVEYQELLVDDLGVAILMAPGGRPLSELPNGRQLETDRLLQLAAGIATSLDTVQRARVVHADVSPMNLLVGDDDRVLLSDFGASRVRSTHAQADGDAKAIGTLEYVSPELTGRMGRAVDERSDLYSMGAVWFELAAGHPPFECDTPLDFVHAHMATAPPALEQLRPDLPGWFCRMVAKLLSKAPDQRYQSAYGVLHDLQAFRSAALAADGPLGQHDLSDHLRFPDALYERQDLLTAIDGARVSAGAADATTVLVCGEPGSGKSAVLQQVRETLAAAGGLFASARFDPRRSRHPYSAIRVSLDGLAMALSELPDAERDRRRTAITAALGANARVLTDLSPSLGAFLGPSAEVLELAPFETLNRLHGTFRALWSACAEPGQPFVLLLDDLQWIDSSSAELLRVVTTVAPPSRFLLLGAYTLADIGEEHALTPLLEALKGAPAGFSEHRTQPLSIAAVRSLLAATLATSDGHALADEVHRLTRGTPYFVRSALARLRDRDALWFDLEARCWAWDLDKVRAQELSDNVIDLITASLQELPQEAGRLVGIAALVGGVASAERLGAIAGLEAAGVVDGLAPALERDLLTSRSDGYDFVDERVREAALALIPTEQRAGLHGAIVEDLLRRYGESELDDHVLEVVGHMLVAAVPDAAEVRAHHARIYRRAARQTASAMAHADTASYLSNAIELYGPDYAADHPEDWFALKLDCATSIGWSGDVSASGEQLAECLELAQDAVQRARVNLIRTAQAAQVGSDYAGAVALASAALRELGLEMPDVTDPDSIQQAVGAVQADYARLMEGREPSDLATLPDNEEARDQLAMSLLAVGLDCAMIGVPAALPVFVISMVNYSIQHGNTDSAALGYMWFGVVQYMGENYSVATAYSDVAMTLHERRPNPRQTPAMLNMLGGFIQHLQVPFSAAFETCRETFVEGERIGENVYGGYGLVNANRQLLRAGVPLAEVRADAANAIARLNEYGNGAMADLTRVIDGLAWALTRDQIEPVDRLDHDAFTEEDFCETYRLVPVLEPLLHVYRVQLLVFQGHYAAARHEVGLVAKPAILGQVETSLLSFYGAFAWLASDPDTEELRAQMRAEVPTYVDALDALADQCPHNYGPCAELVRAESARIEGEVAATETAYEAAISLAEKGGLAHLRGLACERASRFYEERGLTTAARAYFQQAIDAYSQWGATLRVRQLSASRPQWAVVRRGTATSSLDAASLDIAAITEATRIISSEVELDGFLSRTMGIFLKSVGAQSGVLFTQLDGQWWRQARAEGGSVEVDSDQPMRADGTYAHTVTDFVMQTRQAVVLPDVDDEARFSDDPHLVADQPSSVLCVPLLRRGELAGLLYLEHQEARGAFTRQRVELLETLLAQAAISLEHAYLHRNLDTLVRQRTQQLEDARDAAADAHRDVRMVLDSVEQALVLVRPDGRLLGGHSAVVEQWLDRPTLDAPVSSLFEPYDENFALALELGFDALHEDLMPTEVVLESLPQRLSIEDHEFAVTYRPVYDGSDLRHVLVIVSDVTAQVVAEAATQRQRDLLAFFTHLTRDPRSVFGFLSEARTLVSAIAVGGRDDAQLRRQVHTLKGNANLFGLAGFARWLHTLEDRIEDNGGVCASADRAALAERWEELEGQLAPVLSSDPSRTVTIDRERLELAIEKASSGVSGAALAQELREWDWDEVASHLGRLGDQVEALAQRLDKPHVRAVVRADAVRLPPSETWSAFWGALVHVVRNAIDHGVDTGQERVDAGKPRHAQVMLSAHRDGPNLRVEIADDGRGIDWQGVAERAREAGLPGSTSEDLTRALFADGVSTRQSVSELSGRGVGTAAVYAACRSLGGTVEVTSERGHGTRFTFTLPLEHPEEQAEPIAAAG